MNGRASHEQWWDVEEVARAAADCEVRKRRRPDAIAFRAGFGEEVLSLAERLRSGEYRPEPGTVFETERPKCREVHAAAYRDRVVQHLLHRRIEPRLERSFISDSFACRPGKGTHAASRRLQSLMWSASRCGERRVFALQMDIRSFFVSIHKPTLLGLLKRHFTPAERAVQPQHSPWSLAQTLVHHDTSAVARRRGPMENFEREPPHKRLGASGPERGLPSGNLTSQSLANLYLGALDCFVKRTLGARSYVRYVDDFVILHEGEATLRRWEARIREFLRERLKLEAHPVGELLPVSRGVDFVGYIIRPRYLLPRRRVLRSLEEKLKGKEFPLTPRLIGGEEQGRVPGVGAVSGPCRVWRLATETIEALRATWASYEGHLRHASAHDLSRRLWLRHPISVAMLRRKPGRLTRRFARPKLARSYGEQVGVLGGELDDAVLLVQVGARVECPRHRDCFRMGLRFRQQGRRRLGGSVPFKFAGAVIRRALDRGFSVALALEGPGSSGNVREWALRWWFEPLPYQDRTGQLLFLESRLGIGDEQNGQARQAKDVFMVRRGAGPGPGAHGEGRGSTRTLHAEHGHGG